MKDQIAGSMTLVREIEALGQRWGAWRQGERCRSRATELLCGAEEPRQAPEIVVGREEFSVGGEIMVCLHPGCGGFVRGLARRDVHVYWLPLCHCPECGQRYLVRTEGNHHGAGGAEGA
jgi:hypothetical protein